MQKVADGARHIMGMPKGRRDRRVSAILVGMVKSEEGLSYCGLAKRFEKHPDDLERREMYGTYSRTQYQLQVSKIKPEVQQRIITWMAGGDAVHGTKIADSGGYNTGWCIEWQNAKYGKLNVHDFARLHLIHALRGEICVATVTPGHANDSPYLKKMIGMMPGGSGDVLGDAAYCGVKNCSAIRDSGRRAVMEHKSNAVPKGFNARADMLRFCDEHPRTFHNMLRARNNVKERLLDEGGVRRGWPGLPSRTPWPLSCCPCASAIACTTT